MIKDYLLIAGVTRDIAHLVDNDPAMKKSWGKICLNQMQ